MSNVDKIKAIFYDYCQGDVWMEVSEEELNIIAQRIETEVMGVQDDNEFVNLKDLTKEDEITYCGSCGGDASNCDGC